MTGRGHLIFSAATLVIAHQLAFTQEFAHGDWLHLIPGVLLGALLPDLDHTGSILGQHLKVISSPLSKLCGHRGFTHSFLAWLLLTILLLNLPTAWGVPLDLMQAISLGYFSHLVADMLTPTGVPFFWPSPIRIRIPILGSNTNQRGEYFIAVLLLIGLFFMPDHFSFPLSDYLAKSMEWLTV